MTSNVSSNSVILSLFVQSQKPSYWINFHFGSLRLQMAWNNNVNSLLPHRLVQRWSNLAVHWIASTALFVWLPLILGSKSYEQVGHLYNRLYNVCMLRNERELNTLFFKMAQTMMVCHWKRVVAFPVTFKDAAETPKRESAYLMMILTWDAKCSEFAW